MAHILVQEWCAIVINNFVGCPNTTYYVLPQEITHLVNSLVATSIHVHPLERGGGFIGPIKSNPQLWNGYEATVGCRL